MSDYTDIQQELDDFENAVYGEEVRGSMVSAIKKIHDIAESAADAPDATTATAGQVLTADGEGNHYWGDILAESVPTNVRQAIYNILSDVSDDTTNLNTINQWVQNSIVTSLKLTPTSLSFNGLETKRITAKVTPATADISGLMWESSNENVATVSDGLVTSVKNGSCTITASISGISASVSVTVTGIIYPALDSYGENLLSSASNTINALNPNNKLVFGFVTDIHRSHEGIMYGESSNGGVESMKLLARIANAGLLDCVINGGDVVNATDVNVDYITESIEDAYDDFADFYNLPVYSTVGNHDKRYRSERPIQSNAYLKSQMLKPIKSKTGQRITWIDDTNYYVDFTGYAHPIRLVFINEYDAIEGSSTASASNGANCTDAWIPAATVGSGTHNISSANAKNTVLGFIYHGAEYPAMKTAALAYIEAGGKAVLGSFGGHLHYHQYTSSDRFNQFICDCGLAKDSEMNSDAEYSVSVFAIDLSDADIPITWAKIGRTSWTDSYVSLAPVASESIMPAGNYHLGARLGKEMITISNDNKTFDINIPITYSDARINLTNMEQNIGSKWGDHIVNDTANVIFAVKTGDVIKTQVTFHSNHATHNTTIDYWEIICPQISTSLATGLANQIVLEQLYEQTFTADTNYDITAIGLHYKGGGGTSGGPLSFDLQIYVNDVLLTMDNIPYGT